MSGKVDEDTQLNVKLTRAEATEIQWKLIKEWPEKNDVWPYRGGITALAAATALSSISITSHFRKKLKLGSFGKFSMLLPSIVIPSVILPIAHQKMVSEPILLQTECPVCIQFRALMIQNLAGLGYPLLMAPVMGLILANHFATYRLPTFTRHNFPEYYDLMAKFWKPLRLPLLAMFIAQSALAVYISNAEAYSFYSILEQLDKNYSSNAEKL